MGSRERSPARRPRPAKEAAVRLAEYEAKRDFAVTSEPPPGPPAPASVARPGWPPIFMVHKHHARRLHYDLRLELDGALASWAVPRGPSYDPGVKRLAVQTEDHPLDYADFEGRIPDGQYGAGDSLIWDRGTYETVPPGAAARQRAKGHLDLQLRGEKLRGRWHLVRTGRPREGKAQWLFFKAADAAADPAYDVVAARPESVASGRVLTRGPARATARAVSRPGPEQLLDVVFPPMLATAVATLPGDLEAWSVELKYDGYRALAAVSSRRVALWSRNRLDLGKRFPAIVEALGGLVVGDAVLDGEIVVLDARGRPRFERLQAGGDGAARFVVFDLLRLDGVDLRGRPLEARRDLLESLVANAPPLLTLAERLDPEAGSVLATAAARGFEGVILKRRGSRYEGGRASAWLKLKLVSTQDVAIVGFTPHQSASGALGALLVAVLDQGRLTFAGRVGTGFSARQRVELRRELAGDATPIVPVAKAPALPGATWVTPRLVAEVGFAEWTAEGLLRHPSFRGLRSDKSPAECARETPAAVEETAPTSRAPTASLGVTVTLTHPDRVLFPRDGITKQDVARYFDVVAGPLLRALAGRPVALEHYSDGIDRPAWFQQGLARPEPWMTLADTPPRAGGTPARRLVVDRPEALTWCAQHAAFTLHMWSSRVGRLETPDWVVFDLDPAEARGILQAIEAARVLRELFEKLGLASVPKTSGLSGLHVLVPLQAGHTHDEAKEFARTIGAAVARALPDVTVERTPRKRRGRLYLDCLQNGYGKTIVAPYALRARAGAPVSAPLAWSEVTRRLDPSRFTLRTMPRRLDRVGDLFAPALAGAARLPRLQ